MNFWAWGRRPFSALRDSFPGVRIAMGAFANLEDC